MNKMINIKNITNLIDLNFQTEDPRVLLFESLKKNKIDSDKAFIISLDWGIGAVTSDYFEDLNLTNKERKIVQIILGIFDNYNPDGIKYEIN